ncbi:glycosyltransferase family 2 protein [Clostridium sp.]|uniref:glycosyltransferase family 2 protein n=1 Tax=Clostridium sp. TaxID=1506 RepID=UPI00290AE150|nr:glycosyltransferase family 2 protein [Clostridium sp.]MDU6542636.1 glycosyltransferase family 2 protein [Clostridium sp.]
MKICCVIVTYNRKQLLLECIEAIRCQSYKVDSTIIIDNNSSDGTKEFLIENKVLNDKSIYYYKLDKNIGGAGGFYEGIKNSLENEYDWVWIMDDDTIPKNDSLENLILGIKNINEDKISFVASKIIGINGEEMNLPSLSKRCDDSNYPIWMKYLDKSIIEVRAATFVSLLVNTNAIRSVGLPWKEFFIWGDDSEYTMRLTKYYGPAFAIGNSIVVHKRFGPSNLSIVEETNKDRINMYRYQFRNGLINSSEYFGKKITFRIIGGNIKTVFKVLRKSSYKYFKIKVIILGVTDFLFNRYNKKSFINRFDI